MWLTECNHDGTPMFMVSKKLKKCKKLLKTWNHDHFEYVLNKIKRMKELLWKAEELSVRFGNYETVSQLKIELNELYDKEERMWQQRSMITELGYEFPLSMVVGSDQIGL